MVLLVDLEVARVPVGVPMRGRVELLQGVVLQHIVPARVESLPVLVNEPNAVPIREMTLTYGAPFVRFIQ